MKLTSLSNLSFVNITRQFISNIPLPALFREDEWAAKDLSSLYLLLTMQQHLEMPGQPLRVYLPDAMNALRGSTLVHFRKLITFYSLIIFK